MHPVNSSRVQSKSTVQESSLHNELSTLTVEKIKFLKTASEKNKTQTILQKRSVQNSDQDPLVTNAIRISHTDEDIKIVDIVKNNDQGSGIENVIKRQRRIGLMLAKDHPNTEIVINNQFINCMPPVSSSSPSAMDPDCFKRAQTLIKVNPKYSSLSSGTSTPAFSRVQPQSDQWNVENIDLQEYKSINSQSLEKTRPTIRLNPIYTNIVGGKKPEDCENIADTGDAANHCPDQLTVNLEYATSRVPVISSSFNSSPTLTSLLRNDVGRTVASNIPPTPTDTLAPSTTSPSREMQQSNLLKRKHGQHSRSICPPTTLFTLKPLDKTATSFSEMKVMSDNSRIVTTDTTSSLASTTSDVSIGSSYFPVEQTISRIFGPNQTTSSSKDMTPQTDSLAPLSPAKLSNFNQSRTTKKIKDEDGEMEVSCMLTFPNKGNAGQVQLKFENGQMIALDKSFFIEIETKLKSYKAQLDQNYRTKRPWKKNQGKRKKKCIEIKSRDYPGRPVTTIASKKLESRETNLRQSELTELLESQNPPSAPRVQPVEVEASVPDLAPLSRNCPKPTDKTSMDVDEIDDVLILDTDSTSLKSSDIEIVTDEVEIDYCEEVVRYLFYKFF